ncbi:MAG: NYN domain-containing protein [Gudongella sp.]|jgi:predicted RNA-binding protein with PIN domain|nr:NYN domain-containing protein [Gudongella sp.]
MKNKNKTTEYLFVDGYNIINAWDKLKELSKENLEEARNELLEILAEYKHYSGIEVYVIFDAYAVKGSVRSEECFKGVYVVYTKENELADHYIERVLDEIGRDFNIRVATSDWVEQQIVLSRGGTRVSARELESEVEYFKNTVKRKIKKANLKNSTGLGKLEDSLVNRLKDWDKNI